MDSLLTLQIDGMTCDHCASRVTDVLEKLDVKVVDIDIKSGTTHISSKTWVSPGQYEAEISAAGYLLRCIGLYNRVSLPVTGLSCENCVKRVTEALRKIAGVDAVNVELTAGIVDIYGTSELQILVTSINDLGYVVAEKTRPEAEEPQTFLPEVSRSPEMSHHLQIKGMSCASCVASVERGLLNVPGVSSAVVNFADETAFVKSTTDIAPLLAAVQQIGYVANEVEVLDTAGREASNRVAFYSGLWRSGLALLTASILMGGMLLGIFPPVTFQLFWLPVGILVLVVMVVSGGFFFRNAWHSLTYRTTTMDTLIALGTGTAWVYSMMVLLLPSIIPEDSRHLFFEAALFIIGFINLGKSLEMNARGKASSAIEKLLQLSPDTVLLIVDGEEVPTPLKQVGVGDILRIKPGDRIPVDGKITTGFSSIDESMLSGESIPVDKQAGDSLSAGTINLFGSLTMQAEQVGEETTLARMIDMVRQAQNSKPPIGRLTDSIAAVFVPLVLVVALTCVVYWGWIATQGSVSMAVITAMSVLIIACPCALGLAIPMSVMVGMGRGASNGLLIRNSDALQAAAGITTIILDKTGTITEGKPVVTSVKPVGDSIEDLLSLVYSLEFQSEHPLAMAINRYCSERNVQRMPVSEFQISPGGGVSAKLQGVEIRAGNAKFVSLADVPEESGTTVYMTRDGVILGSLNLDDQVKSDSREAINELQSMGVRIIMLSGDNSSSVEKIARQLDISEFESGLSPEGKLARIRELQLQGHKVAMAGDGINDAPALGIADVGFAMASGTDIAIESADIAIVGSRLTKVVSAIKISKLTMRNIYQNLFGAFAYNIVLIPIAAGLLYPVLISPAFAGLAMAMSSVTVVANALRLRFAKL